MRISTGDLARRVGLFKPRLPFGGAKENEDRKTYPLVVHELSEEQIQKVRDAIGDGTDWPQHTDDPYVNFVVDCLVCFEWHERPSFEKMKSMYVEEIDAFKALASADT